MPVGVKWHGREVKIAIDKQLKRNLNMAAILVQRAARDNVRSGGKSGLHVITGTLHRSITTEVKGFIARIGTNLKYARIHELGGIIRPKSAKALHFTVGGRHRQAQVVHIPARPYLRPALHSNKRKIEKILSTPMRGETR